MGEENQTIEGNQTADDSGSQEDQGGSEESLIYEVEKARDDELETK